MKVLEILAEASAAFAEASADSERLLSTIGRHVSNAVGDVCGIRLRQHGTDELGPLTFFHRDTERHENLAAALAASEVWSAEGIMRRAADSGTTLDVPTFAVDDPTGLPALERGHAAQEHPGDGTIVVALRARGRSLGVLGVARDSTSLPYTPQELSLVECLAASAAMAIELARALQRERAALVHRDAQHHGQADAARAEVERERATLRSLFLEAPACIAIVRKGDYHYELSNRLNNATAGVSELTGRTLQEALPELVAQGVTALVDNVIETGQPIWFTEQPAVVNVDGRPKHMFFNGVFQAVRGVGGSIEAVANFAFEVTDQVLAKRRAEHAEQETKLLAESIPAIVWRADPDGKTDHYNSRWYEYTGLPEGSLGEDAWSRACHPEDLPAIATRWRESLSTGSVFEAECRLRRGADGAYRWHLARSVPHKDAAGRVLGWFGASVDVEEVKRATEERSTLLLQAEAATAEARAQREWMNSILMQAPVAIALYRGPDYVIDLVNPLMCQIWGRPSEQVVGRPYAEAFPEVAAQGFVALAFDSVYRTGTPFFATEMPIRFDPSGNGVLGEERFFSFVHVPLRVRDGRTEGIVAVASEVTEQVLARRRIETLAHDLRASEEQFRALVENLPDLAWSAEADGHIDFYNQRWYEYTGTTFEEMEGWGWEKVHQPSVLPEVVSRWKHSLATGEPFEMEFPLRGTDGTFRTFLTRVRPLRHPDGRIIRWFGTNTDIEDRQRMASDLRKALQLRDEFLSIAGHELRTPLAALLLHVQSVQRTATHGLVPARVLERLAKAEGAGVRLEKLINQLLDVSRIQAGRLTLQTKRIDLVSLVRNVVEYHSRQAAPGEGKIALDAPATLIGTWDEERLDQVVTNLLTNAIKYGRGAPIEVWVGTRDGQAIIRVTDHGIGIPREQQDALFQRFERAAASADYGGLGLGLWITRRIVEACGGRVEVDSEPGRGSTFTVILPMHSEEGDDSVQG